MLPRTEREKSHMTMEINSLPKIRKCGNSLEENARLGIPTRRMGGFWGEKRCIMHWRTLIIRKNTTFPCARLTCVVAFFRGLEKSPPVFAFARFSRPSVRSWIGCGLGATEFSVSLDGAWGPFRKTERPLRLRRRLMERTQPF